MYVLQVAARHFEALLASWPQAVYQNILGTCELRHSSVIAMGVSYQTGLPDEAIFPLKNATILCHFRQFEKFWIIFPLNY